MNISKKIVLPSLSLLLSITIAISFVIPSSVASAKTQNNNEIARQNAIKAAKNVEGITGTEDIVQSSESNGTYSSKINNGESIIKIPSDGNQPIQIEDPNNANESLKINLPFENTNTRAIKTDNGTIVYNNPEGNSSVNLAVQPTQDGVKSLINIENKTAPKEYRFKIDVPEGSKLITAADYLGKKYDTKEVFIVDSNNIITSVFTPAWAKDADGSDIPTYYKVEGNTLIQVVEFNKNNVFPIIADPNWVQIGKCAAALAWVIGSNLFMVAKIIKIKKYIDALGGFANAAKLLVQATTWEEKLRAGGSALVGLAAEITGVAALSVCRS